jgi:hypothetical protein
MARKEDTTALDARVSGVVLRARAGVARVRCIRRIVKRHKDFGFAILPGAGGIRPRVRSTGRRVARVTLLAGVPVTGLGLGPGGSLS